MVKELFQPIFPYGLAHVATSLLGCGHHVEVLDIYANQWNRREVLGKLGDLSFDAIGITAMSTQYAYVKWLAGEIRQRTDAPIILGGLLATYSPEIVLDHTAVDICVLGEGELTVTELIDNLDDLRAVRGVAFKEGGETVITEPRPYIENLDSLPRPAYDLFPMDVYTKTRFYIHDSSTKIFRKRFGFATMGVLAGRGCPYNCNFCSKSFEGLRLKSVDGIISEIQYLKDEFGVEGIHFIDELLIVNKKRGYELAEKIAPLDVVWDAQGRVNTVDYDLLVKLKEAGCVGVGLGIESGSDEILRNMNKRITAEQSFKAVDIARKAGMHVKVQLIMGYPGETAETVQETVDLFARLDHPGRRFSLILPLPGSTLYDQALADGLIENEEEYIAQISGGYGASRYPVFINFTDMTTRQIYELKARAEKQMARNYRKYLAKHPGEYVEYVYGCFMNAVNLWIRRMIKFCGDPAYYVKRALLRIKGAFVRRPKERQA